MSSDHVIFEIIKKVEILSNRLAEDVKENLEIKEALTEVKSEKARSEVYFILPCTVAMKGLFVFLKTDVISVLLMARSIMIRDVRFTQTTGSGILIAVTTHCGY